MHLSLQCQSPCGDCLRSGGSTHEYNIDGKTKCDDPVCDLTQRARINYVVCAWHIGGLSLLDCTTQFLQASKCYRQNRELINMLFE